MLRRLHQYVVTTSELLRGYILPTPHFSDLQKEQGILQERLSALELKCSELQISNRDLTKSLEHEKSSVRSAEATHQEQLFAEEKKRLALEAAAKDAQIPLEESRTKVNDLTVENEKLRQEIEAAKAVPPPPPSPPKGAVEDSDVVAALRADVARLQSEQEELVRKSNTIGERYKSGDLVCPPIPSFAQSLTEGTQTDHERTLVRTVRGEARIAQEQQLDMKSNELIRVS